MNVNQKTGLIGQYKGPFSENYIITLDTPYNIKLGISIGEKDSMHNLASQEINQWDWVSPVLIIEIDEQPINIVIGQKCMYDLDTHINHHIIKFPSGAPASTIIDYMLLEREE